MKHPLAIFRARQSLKQRDVAEAVGVTRWTIAMIEAGKYDASGKLLRRLIEFTGGEVTANELVRQPEAAQ